MHLELFHKLKLIRIIMKLLSHVVIAEVLLVLLAVGEHRVSGEALDFSWLLSVVHCTSQMRAFVVLSAPRKKPCFTLRRTRSLDIIILIFCPSHLFR